MSGPTFAGRTRFIHKILQSIFPAAPAPGFHPLFPDGVEVYYPTAPHRLIPASESSNKLHSTSKFDEPEREFDAWTWGRGDYYQSEVIDGYKESVQYILPYMRKYGPFQGVVGFSVGASMAFGLVSLAERADCGLLRELGVESEMLPPPFLFAILCSGFIMQNPIYETLYYPRIQTPCLHTLGIHDGIIDPIHTRELAERCEVSALMAHDGAHFVLRGRRHRVAMEGLIRAAVGVDVSEGSVGEGSVSEWSV